MPRYPRQIIPTGTGMPHITSGVQDAASKLVENADVHASAAIAESKINPVPSTLIATHAAANVSASVHPNAAIIKSGNYEGTGVANRAVAHGLGVAPKAVFIRDEGVGWSIDIIRPGYIQGAISSAANNETFSLFVTAVDSTNFYVGNATDYQASANNTGATFHWVAMA